MLLPFLAIMASGAGGGVTLLLLGVLLESLGASRIMAKVEGIRKKARNPNNAGENDNGSNMSDGEYEENGGNESSNSSMAEDEMGEGDNFLSNTSTRYLDDIEEENSMRDSDTETETVDGSFRTRSNRRAKTSILSRAASGSGRFYRALRGATYKKKRSNSKKSVGGGGKFVFFSSNKHSSYSRANNGSVE